MSEKMKQEDTRRDERVGLLFGYHEDMYKDDLREADVFEKCCAMYCTYNNATSWVFAASICCMIIGPLCVLYGYFLPSLYMTLAVPSLTSGKIPNKSNQAKLREIYFDRNVFLIVGLSVLFLGGIMFSFSLFMPFYGAKRSNESFPSSSRITVKNELGSANTNTQNCIKAKPPVNDDD